MHVTMVRADHSCGLTDGDQTLYGGVAAGYVVRLPGGFTFYHAGDTALFSDMQLFGEMYRPELAFLPIGDLLHHGPPAGRPRLPLPRGAQGDPDPLGDLPRAHRHAGDAGEGPRGLRDVTAR